MSLTERSVRRCLPVRLSDVRTAERARAAHGLLRGCDAGEAEALLAAVVHPSDTVYWVEPSAAAILDRVAA